MINSQPLRDAFQDMERPGRVLLPDNTKRRGGLVLSTQVRAKAVALSEKRRAKMYALMEAHPETAEQLQARVNALRPKPLPKPKHGPSGRAKTRSVYVPSPTVPGHRETLDRVFSTIEHMRSRKQIDSHSYRAAERLWTSHEIVLGQAGGSMDMDRARGGRLPGSPPLPSHLEAADNLNFAKRVLYPLDHRVVVLVACEGYTLDQVTRMVCGTHPARAQREEIGRRFRQGLRELADRWWGAAMDESEEISGAEPRIWRQSDARPREIQPGVIARGKTIHATAARVFRNK